MQELQANKQGLHYEQTRSTCCRSGLASAALLEASTCRTRSGGRKGADDTFDSGQSRV